MSNTNPVLYPLHLAIEPFLEGPCSTADKMGQLRILHTAVHTKCDTS